VGGAGTGRGLGSDAVRSMTRQRPGLLSADGGRSAWPTPARRGRSSRETLRTGSLSTGFGTGLEAGRGAGWRTGAGWLTEPAFRTGAAWRAGAAWRTGALRGAPAIGGLGAAVLGWVLAVEFDWGNGGSWDIVRGAVRAPERASLATFTGASVRIDEDWRDVVQATRGPLGATLPSDQPSAGQRAGRGSGSRSLRSITRWDRPRRGVSITTTVDVSDVDDVAARWRRPCGARLRRALRKRCMLRLESGVEWTIHAIAAITTSHNPTASRLTTKPLIGPPPFHSCGILADP
jgi:hypothetical protein